ncbi:hypothetical protein J1N10_05210 [Carboxylicivirga sp. A043]|uniref:carboxylate--amine ligase n=1 Tax=Carboxylicivirga litoralis TaxID=2816963 RepID=UPI0021CB6277|nr:hypothetical protein [Carboxylicivirga sp. A043]MCU4155363.1 hypothetical protein [Carboxylicivirga sp. A043]
MKALSTLNPVIVLDITHAGYGILKSLYRYKIPLYGFTFCHEHIELKTRYAQKTFIYNSLENLKFQLIELSKNSILKPVLMLTNDEKVEFVMKNLNELKQYLIINVPEPKIANSLTDKILLKKIVKELKIRVPQTVNIEQKEDSLKVKELTLPIIVKPFLKSDEWHNAGFSKAHIFEDYNSFEKVFPKMFEVEPRIVAQEFIPGGDNNIYYCLTYYNSNGECICHFTGQKIRQWKVLTGSTASTRPTINPFVTNETLRIFNSLKLKGLGSIEFKKHEITGEFYMIEPTAGRVNLQEYIATCAGVNIPLKAYCDMTGHKIHPLEKVNPNVIFIDERSELLSFFEYNSQKNLSIYKWFESVKGKRYYRLLNSFDYKICLSILLITTRRLSGFFLRKSLNIKRP